MSFNPSIVFHKENGGAVKLEVDSSALSTLTAGSSLELNFDYDATDIDSLGVVQYVNKADAIESLSSILGYMDKINLPNKPSLSSNYPSTTSNYRFSTSLPVAKNSGDTFTADHLSRVELIVSFGNEYNHVNKDSANECTISGSTAYIDISIDNLSPIYSANNKFWVRFDFIDFLYRPNGEDAIRINRISGYASSATYTNPDLPTAINLPLNSVSARIGASQDEVSELSSIREQVSLARSRGARYAENPAESLSDSDSKSISMSVIDSLNDGYGNFIPSKESDRFELDLNIEVNGYNYSADEMFGSFKSFKLYVFNKSFVSADNLEEYVSSANNEGYKIVTQGKEVGFIESDNLIYNYMMKRLELRNLHLESSKEVNNIILYLEFYTIDDQVYKTRLEVNVKKSELTLPNDWIDGELYIPSDLGCSPTYNNIACLFTENDLSSVRSATWSLQYFNNRNGQYEVLWSHSTSNPGLFKSIGSFDELRLTHRRLIDRGASEDYSKFMDKFAYNDVNVYSPDLNNFEGDDLIYRSAGIPITNPVYIAKSEKNIIVNLVLFGEDGRIIGDYNTMLDSVNKSKYKSFSRTDLFSTAIYKLPFLTKTPGNSSITYLNRRYVEPINPSISVLSPIGHESSSLLGYKKLPDTNIGNIALTNPYTFNMEKNDDKFNYTVFNDLDHLVDFIYSLSFATISNRPIDGDDLFRDEVNNFIDRRPIEILVGNQITNSESYKAVKFDEFTMTRDDIERILKSKAVDPDNFNLNPEGCNRRITVLVYSTTGVISYPLFMESVVVAFKGEIPELKSGPDGYLEYPINISKVVEWLDYDPNIGSKSYTPSLVNLGNSKTLSSDIVGSGEVNNRRPSSYKYLPNYLKLFKSNFEYYGVIPFWLCTDKSLLGFTGEFLHRVEGYKEGQEVVHPVTGDLYICIKDRPGVTESLSIEKFDSIEHTYPVDTETYNILNDEEYFVKVSSLDGSFTLDSDSYKKIYKSSLPTYPALLSYLNLLVNSKDGLIFNPYTNKDDCIDTIDSVSDERVFKFGNSLSSPIKSVKDGVIKEISGSYFPYTYLEDYLDKMSKYKDRFLAEDTTVSEEEELALLDCKFGAWFKLKNLNYHTFTYHSTRPLLWVKDKAMIARANLAHPRNNVIRVGTKFYYLRLTTDQFYPEDDCCMESTIISSIPNQTMDFTTFNDPWCLNFRETLISPTIRNVLWLSCKDGVYTPRDRGIKSNILTDVEKNIVGDKIVSINIMSNKKDTNYFSRKGGLVYTASPFSFYLSSGDKSPRVMDLYHSSEIMSNIVYNIYDSIPDFEYGSSVDRLGLNEIVFKDPMACITFQSESVESRSILGIDSWNSLSNTKTLTGVDSSNNGYNYNCDLKFVKYGNSEDGSSKLFEDYYPVYVVLESVDEKDLPIYNIKDSLLDFIGEPELGSIDSLVSSYGDKIDVDIKDFILKHKTSSDSREFTYNRLTPSWNTSGITIPFIRNGGYHYDIVSDIDYRLTSRFVKDLINYTPVEGPTPDTQFNTDPNTMFEMSDRKTYGTINLSDVKLGNWGNYKTVTSNSSDRYIKRRCYDRWSMVGYLGSISINNANTKNILFTQLEKIVKHRLVNNDLLREKESKLYPTIHVYYYKNKLVLMPSDLPFDVYDNSLGFKMNASLDYLECGRSKPIDNRSKDVDRVKLGSNVFDVVVPYMVNDRYIKNNQELKRKIIPVDGYGK